MKQILCFGDSNTWGYDGESRERLPWGVRWTSLLQEKLNKEEYRVIEEGLCGRTTVFEDPLRDGKKRNCTSSHTSGNTCPGGCDHSNAGNHDAKLFLEHRRCNWKGNHKTAGSDPGIRTKSESPSHVSHLSGRKSMAGRI